jgi:hypothetical protein
VTDSGGRLLGGATVEVADGPPNTNAGRRATSDGEGHYTLDGLAFTGFALTASAAGYSSRTDAVSMQAGNESLTKDFVLSAVVSTFTLHGTVSIAGGPGLQDATVKVTDAAPHPNAGRNASTNRDGTFELAGLATGTTTLLASASGYESGSRTVQVAAGVTDASVAFSLQPHAPAPDVLTLTGTVKTQAGTPISSGVVSITDGPPANIGKSATTDSGGGFRIGGVTSGASTVSITAAGYQTLNRTVQISGDSVPVDFVLLLSSTPTYEVKGIVTGFDGGPVGNATVAITDPAPNPNAGRTARTDSKGAYSLSGLAFGAVSLSVSATAYQTSTRAVQMLASVTSAAIDFALTPTVSSYSIRGNVARRSRGGPVTGAAVNVLITGAGAAVTDASGNYSITGVHFQSLLPVLVQANGFQAIQTSVPLVFGTETATADFLLFPQEGITFNGIGTGPMTTWAEKGFTTTITQGSWRADDTMGSPSPAIVFDGAAGTTTMGTVRVVGDGRTFRFESVDFHTVNSAVLFLITGMRGGATVFQWNGSTGPFATLQSKDPTSQIDTLIIQLTNSTTACCSNAMGLDNIRVYYP